MCNSKWMLLLRFLKAKGSKVPLRLLAQASTRPTPPGLAMPFFAKHFLRPTLVSPGPHFQLCGAWSLTVGMTFQCAFVWMQCKQLVPIQTGMGRQRTMTNWCFVTVFCYLYSPCKKQLISPDQNIFLLPRLRLELSKKRFPTTVQRS